MKARNVFIVFLTILISLCSACDGPPLRMPERRRAILVEYYEDDANYVDIICKLEGYLYCEHSFPERPEDVFVRLDFCDIEDEQLLRFEEHMLLSDKDGYEHLKNYYGGIKEGISERYVFGGIIYAENLLIAKENGFDLDNAENEYIITISFYSLWWPGWSDPIASIKSRDGSKTYLDYEQGKANVVNWLQNVIYR